MAQSALIGHTGFVGGTLKAARQFDRFYNSSNIEDIAQQSYDLVVCAGVSAVKWLANKDPDADKAAIDRLVHALSRASIREFILISTIDVYPDTASGADESATIDPASNHAYGAHRFELEKWCKAHFPTCRIVRLPALFGAGLRKNALFDLLHDNDTAKINPLGKFQWYPVGRLAKDLDVIREHDLKLVNLFGEGLTMGAVRDAFFPGAVLGQPVEPAPTYNLRTRHAQAFGGSDGYVISAQSLLGEMARFVAEQRCLVQAENHA